MRLDCHDGCVHGVLVMKVVRLTCEAAPVDVKDDTQVEAEVQKQVR